MTDPMERPFNRVPYTAEGVLNDSGVNIRTQPFTQNSASLAKVNKGTKVSITAKVTTEADPPNWYELDFQNQTGYIAANFVSPSVATTASSGSPGSVLLPVPWFSQVDSRHFEACGPTSVLMLLRAYQRGGADSLDDMSQFITITQTTNGGQLIVAARDAGPLALSASAVTPANLVDTLTSHLSQRKPVVLLIDYVKLTEAPFNPPRHLKRGATSVNHWWVVVGMDGDHFVINDPLWQSSENHGIGGRNLPISSADLVGACANSILTPSESLP
jgi:uncharacterized protein YvpB